MGEVSPWDVIGWAFVVGLCCIGLFFSIAMLSSLYWRRVLWKRSCNLTPERGQVWSQSGGKLYVMKVDGEGESREIHLRSHGIRHVNEWKETMGAWNERVMLKQVYLLAKETDTFRRVLATEGN